MEEETNTGTPETLETNNHKNGNGLKITAVIACLIAICGICFGIYGIIRSNSNPPSGNSQSGTNGNTEKQALNIYEINDLKYKTLRLLGYRNGLSSKDYYKNDSGIFMVYSGYMPIALLAANELDTTKKIYITLETTLSDKEKYCDYKWTDGVKDDIDSILKGTAYENTTFSFGNSTFDCVSYDKANDDYYSLWGEELPKINIMSDDNTNNDFAYGKNLDAYYYHIIGGRGGICSSNIIGKIKEISSDQNSAYVDINAGLFSVCADDTGNVYSDIEGKEIYKSIEQSNLNWDNLGLVESDYKSFQSYRFTFKKNASGIYSFSSIEK